jgi:hypothetical protein
MKKGDRIYLENEDLRAALASGMVEPHGVDSLGKTVYLLTRAGEILTGAGHLNVGSTAQKIQRSHPLLLGRPGPLGLA